MNESLHDQLTQTILDKVSPQVDRFVEEEIMPGIRDHIEATMKEAVNIVYDEEGLRITLKK